MNFTPPSSRGPRATPTSSGPAASPASAAPAEPGPDTPLAALFAAARAARAQAHAPYSRFQVGAAVLDEQGRVHAGCNVENAAYPQGWCAETSALAAMVSAGGRRVQAVAVAGPLPRHTAPCGGCRQKIAEFAGPDCVVHLLGTRGAAHAVTLGELLPLAFDATALAGKTAAGAPRAAKVREASPAGPSKGAARTAAKPRKTGRAPGQGGTPGTAGSRGTR